MVERVELAPDVTVLLGDCREAMRRLPAESVHCVITSPPYLGLRDYGLPPSIWGGVAGCEHEWQQRTTVRKGPTHGREGSTLASAGSAKTVGSGAPNNHGESREYRADQSAFCVKCGAWRGCLGLEPAPDLFVAHLVEVCREIWRVLRPDGTFWLNMGDSYNGCVDEETEALTESGWKHWNQLRAGDRILTLNPETYLAEWGVVEGLNIHPPARRLVLVLEGRGHSSITTGDHRWYTERRTGRGHTKRHVRGVTTSAELNSEHRIPIAAQVANLPTTPKYPDALVESVAWYWTKGHDRKPGVGRTQETGAYICQSNKVNPHNVTRIERCLTALLGPKSERLPGVKGASPTWTRYDWAYRDDKAEFRLNAAAARLLRQYAPGKVPMVEWLSSLTQAQLDLFIDTSLAADGHTAPDGCCELAQNSREGAEAFQIACILAGRAATLAKLPSTGHWNVTVRKHRWIKPMRHHPEWREHTGMVWCPTTNNGSWLARRSGRVFFTGNSGGAGGDYGPGGLKEGQPKFPGRRVEGLKQKDACLIPERLILALQADGWWVRAKIPWVKKNAMPESATDRPAVSHEQWFMLTKNGERLFWVHRELPGTRVQPAPDYRWVQTPERLDGETPPLETADEPPDWRTVRWPDGRKRWRRINLWQGRDYFWDADAIRLTGTSQSAAALSWDRSGKHSALRVPGQNYPQHRPGRDAGRNGEVPATRSRRTSDWWFESLDDLIEQQRAYLAHLEQVKAHGGVLLDEAGLPLSLAANPEPLAEAHFATFPSGVVRPIVLAGTSPQACPHCRAPWARTVTKEPTRDGRPTPEGPRDHGVYRGHRSKGSHNQTGVAVITTGWSPTCDCEGNDGSGACVVLDPFAGSGTTLMVAASLGRKAIGCELNPEYIEIMRRRLSGAKAQRALQI